MCTITVVNMIVYVKSTTGCDTVITVPGTEIRSENYPANFPPNMECNYVIKLKEGQRVRLEFLEFRLPPNNGNCGKYVTIFF